MRAFIEMEAKKDKGFAPAWRTDAPMSGARYTHAKAARNKKEWNGITPIS
jgi:hypothetical protein